MKKREWKKLLKEAKVADLFYYLSTVEDELVKRGEVELVMVEQPPVPPKPVDKPLRLPRYGVLLQFPLSPVVDD